MRILSITQVQSPGEITRLLDRMRGGDADAESELVSLVYAQLRRLAAAQLRHEQPSHTLQPTALVNETYLRLLGRAGNAWQNREHFFRAASRAMRHVLVDHARAARAARRGGGLAHVELSDDHAYVEDRADEILALDEVLDRLEKRSARQKTIVEMRFYAGFTDEEIGEILNISTRTVKRDWAVARAWLYSEIHGQSDSA